MFMITRRNLQQALSCLDNAVRSAENEEKEFGAMWSIVCDTSCRTTECPRYDAEIEDCTGHPGVCPVVQEAMR